MKTTQFTICFPKYFCLIGVLLFSLSCSKDESDSPTNPVEPTGQIITKEGITEEDLDTNLGQLGVYFDARPLMKKGYTPKTISITTGAVEGNYDATLEINEFTSMARLSVDVEGLDEPALNELKDGIQITAVIKDANGAALMTLELEKQAFSSNGTEIKIDDNSLVFLSTEVNFIPDASYYLQYTVNGDLKGGVDYYGTWVNSPDGANSIVVRREIKFLPSLEHEQFGFYKYPGETDLFAIYVKSSKRYLAVHPDGVMRSSGLITFEEDDPATIGDQYKFRIWKTGDGFFRIGDINGNPFYELKGQDAWTTGNGTVTSDMGEIGNFKIVTADIEWTSVDLGTEYLEPILPPNKAFVGFSSTLINCTSGDLKQEVGYQRTLSLTETVSIAETFWFSGRITTSIGFKVFAEVSVPFKAVSAKVGAEINGNLEVSVEAGKEQNFESTIERSSSETINSKRDYTVPAGQGTLLTDNYRIYENLTIPFVQRIRISGTLNGETLLSEEIKDMLYASTFDGVIVDSGDTFVDITLRGNINFGNRYDVENLAENIPDACED